MEFLLCRQETYCEFTLPKICTEISSARKDVFANNESKANHIERRICVWKFQYVSIKPKRQEFRQNTKVAAFWC